MTLNSKIKKLKMSRHCRMKIAGKTFAMEHISEEPENTGTKIIAMDSADQRMQEANEEGQAHVENIDLMRNKPNHSVDLTVVQETSIAEQTVEVLHIDFIFGNQRWIFKDQDMLVHMQQLKHLMVRS